VSKLGKTIAVAEDFPAFIVNRNPLPMINEAIYAALRRRRQRRGDRHRHAARAHHPMGLWSWPISSARILPLFHEVLHEGSDSQCRPCPLR
jgi:3-hydroxybutyryl-CoA dehydrogenase